MPMRNHISQLDGAMPNARRGFAPVGAAAERTSATVDRIHIDAIPTDGSLRAP